MSFFGTNPLSTQVGQLIERATDPTVPDENVELIYEICDVINTKEENAKDAMKAIRKKMSIYAGRNWSVVIKLLNIVDICVSNCNKRFHVQIANKDFLQELKNMIGPKLQPPIPVQEKVLTLIQKWANAFKHDSELKGVESFYNDLRSKGIDFPVADESKSNIVLDPESIEANVQSEATAATTTTRQPTMIRQQQPNAAAAAALPTMVSLTSPPQPTPGGGQVPTVAAAITLTAEQIAKLNSELDVVECNVQVFNDVINELTQTQTQSNNLDEYNAEIELLRELYRTCKDMQARVTQLVGSITNEALINELLRVNDDLNNVFLRHERFERGLPPSQNTSLAAGGGGSSAHSTPNSRNQNIYTSVEVASAATAMPRHNRPPVADEKPLIDFGDDGNANANKLSKIHLTSKNEYENVKYALPLSSPLSLTFSPSSDPATAFLQDENEIKEIENWLKTQDGSSDDANKDVQNEFEDFLNQRAAAGQSQQQQSQAAAAANANITSSRNIKTDTKSKFEL